MESLYNPDGVEERWQQTWEAEGLYNAEADDPRESFAIAHPPPNVTGDLHLGHALQLSLSDLELAHVEVDDALTYVRYPLVDGEGHITIATVRPATILADVAVAVHPDDERYRELVGKEVVVPFVERRVPVIADERVEMD